MIKTWIVALVAAWLPVAVFGQDIEQHLKHVRAVQREGHGHPAAIEAARQLQQLPASQLPRVLVGMDGANPLAVNWLRGIIETIADRAERARQPLPLEELELFLNDTSHHPRARRLAYELIARHDADAEKRLVSGWVDDPSLELRRDAVAWLLGRAAAAREKGDTDEAVRLYKEAFAASRDIDQVQSLAKTLTELGHPVDTAEHLGFLRDWHIIGPFDSTGGKGFAIAYPPETAVNLEQKLPGKTGEVAWMPARTDDGYGVIDLNEVLGKHKGAVAYAFAAFHAEQPQDVELRLGSINANKVWLNGELLTSNEIYHTNMFIDQYVGRGRLKAGRNEILVKIAQNEQTEAWAEAWMFQLRVCDAIGTAVRSTPAGDQASVRQDTL